MGKRAGIRVLRKGAGIEFGFQKAKSAPQNKIKLKSLEC